MTTEKPQILDFNSHGSSNIGFITVAECQKDIPFAVERVYWTYYTPNNIERGGHAHRDLYQVLVAVSGSITITTEDRDGNTEVFVLDKPNQGLLLPPPYWHTMKFSHAAVLLSLCSMHYEEQDYIRDYEVFKSGR
jgi:hypothetical protein